MRVRKNPNHDQGTITREELEKKEQVDLGTVDIPGKGRDVLAETLVKKFDKSRG